MASVRTMRRLSSSTTVRTRRSPRPVSVEDAIDALRDAPQLGHHRQQLLPGELVAIDHGVVAATGDELGRRGDQREIGPEHAQRSVHRDEGARQQHDVGGQPHAEAGQGGHEVLDGGRVHGAAGPDVLGHQPGQGALQLVG